MKNIDININIDGIDSFYKTAKSITDIKTELKEAKKNMESLGTSTKEFSVAQNRVALLNKELKQFSNAISPSTFRKDLVEDLSKSLEKVKLSGDRAGTALMDMGGGVNDTMTALNLTVFQGNKSFMEMIMVAQRGEAITRAIKGSVEAWAGAQEVLNGVMAANPIGVIILAITALTAVMYALYKSYDDSASIISDTNTYLIEQDKIITELRKSIVDLGIDYDVLTGKITELNAAIKKESNKVVEEQTKAQMIYLDLVSKQVDKLTAVRGDANKKQLKQEIEANSLSQKGTDEAFERMDDKLKIYLTGFYDEYKTARAKILQAQVAYQAQSGAIDVKFRKFVEVETKKEDNKKAAEYAKVLKDKLQATSDFYEALRDKQIIASDNEFAIMLDNAERYKLISEQDQLDLQKANEQSSQEFLDFLKEKQTNLEKERSSAEENYNLLKTYDDNLLKKRIANVNKWVDYSEERLTDLASISQGLYQIDLSNYEQGSNAKLKMFQKQKDQGIIGEEEYNQKVLALQNDQALKEKELKKKYADVDFAIKVAQIISSTAQAIMNSFATLPLPAAIVASSLLGVLGGVQVGLANEQRETVKQLKYGGIIDGPSHDNGGVKYYSQGGNVELEGGEGVINKRSMSIPWIKSVASQLNEYGGYGQSFGKGGITPNEISAKTSMILTQAAPIKTYVTIQDVNSMQELNNVITRRSKLK